MPDATRLRRALEGLLGVPASEGNQVEILRDGVEIFPSMLEAIQHAERTIDLLTFIYWRGDIAERFADALCERSKAGVRVRVILDALGARHLENHHIDAMGEAGVLIHWFREVTDLENPGHRTHRKVLICDEQVAYAGGVGIAEEWDGSSDDGSGWRETQVRLQGPAVDGLRAAFVDDWLESDNVLFDDHDRFPEQPQCGTVAAMVVRGESEFGWNDLALLRRALLELAQQRVRFTTGYLTPDEDTMQSLCAAANRGVQVQILTPGPQSDKQSSRFAAARCYQELLDAGVEIHHFQPTMLHAKTTTVDGIASIVGSANLNNRSLRLDEEIDVVFFDEGITAQLDAHIDADLERSERVDIDDWEERSVFHKVPEAVVGLIEQWA